MSGPLRSKTVLVAVESAQVREALVAMLGALDGFSVVAEVDNDEAAIEAARRQRPLLAVVEPELSGCGGWWAIKQMQAEHLAGVVVAIGRRGEDVRMHLDGAQTYIQMGAPPHDLLKALEGALAAALPQPASGAQAEHDLLADSHPVI